MTTVALYIYVDNADGIPISNRIELFDDEAISVTSSIQNFRDLGKIFTDYTQAFTIPASKYNNKLLKHWYNSEVGETSLDAPLDAVGAFDHRVNYYGYIEIDTIPFRYGKFTLKGSKKVNNKIESYTIEFKGNLVQLKERFKDDKLRDLNKIIDGVRVSYYDVHNHLWNPTNVAQRIVNLSGTENMLYPLIGSSRKLYYNSGVAAQDITTTTGKLKYNELFPALRVSTILGYIQDMYGITFEGAFINSQTFTKLFLYLKNQNEFEIRAQELMIDFTSKSANTRIEDVFGNLIDTATGEGFDDLNLTSNVLTYDTDRINQFFNPPTTSPTNIPNKSYRRNLRLTITTASTNPYNVLVYNNGVLYTTFENAVGTRTFLIGLQNEALTVNTETFNFTFFISSEQGISFTSEIKQRIQMQGYYSGGGFSGFTGFYSEYQTVTGSGTAQTTVSNIDVKSFVPDITVEAFITGLIKMFNLMVLPTGETSFYLQPLVDYYKDGTVRDLTKYVIADDMAIDAPQLYKNIEFKYQKSENVLNERFRTLFNRDYADLVFENKTSAFTETYEVELPFENFMFERETGTDFQTATVFNKDLQPYVPKPTLMYHNGQQEVDPVIKFGDNLTTIDLAQYARFNNEIQLAGSDLSYVQSLAWGAEISSWLLTTSFVGLYQKFYSPYIENLFNQRTRIVKFKAKLPSTLLCDIKLNDTIVISKKRYTINTMSPELTSGVTSFELILDNTDVSVLPDEILRLSNIQELNLDNTAQQIEIQIFKKDYDLWRTKLAGGFLAGSYTITPNIYTDGLVNVSVPANGTASVRSDDVLIEFFKGSDSFTFHIKINQNA